MNDVVLAGASLFLLGWVIYLKIQIAGMLVQNEKLLDAVRDRVDATRMDIEVTNGRAVYGQKPSWLK